MCWIGRQRKGAWKNPKSITLAGRANSPCGRRQRSRRRTAPVRCGQTRAAILEGRPAAHPAAHLQWQKAGGGQCCAVSTKEVGRMQLQQKRTGLHNVRPQIASWDACLNRPPCCTHIPTPHFPPGHTPPLTSPSKPGCLHTLRRCDEAQVVQHLRNAPRPLSTLAKTQTELPICPPGDDVMKRRSSCTCWMYSRIRSGTTGKCSCSRLQTDRTEVGSKHVSGQLRVYMVAPSMVAHNRQMLVQQAAAGCIAWQQAAAQV